jgi:hypothetical protein
VLLVVAVALLLALDVWTCTGLRKRSSPVAARVWFWGVAALLAAMLCMGPVMLRRYLSPQGSAKSNRVLRYPGTTPGCQ